MKSVAQKIKNLLREENAVILAFIALGLAIQEVFFGVMPEWVAIVEWIQCGIIVLLLMEWCASVWAAEDRKEHLLDHRTLGGLAILLVCFLAFSPSIAHVLAKSPWLKIVRVAPVIVFGFISTRPLFISRTSEPELPPSEEIGFRRIESESNHGIGFTPLPKEEFESWMANPNREGCRCAIAQYAGAVTGDLALASIPAPVVRSALAATSYPRVSRLGATFVFSGSLPLMNERDPLQTDVQSASFAFLCTSKSFLLAESHPSIGIALGQLLKDKSLLPEHPLHSRLALGLFSLLITRYEDVANRLASEVQHLMMLPMGRHSDKAYLTAFSLQRSLARMKSDMWRLGQIFDRFEKGRLALPFEGADFMAMYESFSDACDFTSEAFSQSHDAASSTIDLRINLASFQMNRFMGLLAVATAVGIIPATMSGFLGMNIQGANFPVTLGNVAFWAVMLVALVLYFLKTRGWLRF